jgi:hypothetical protein
VGTPFYTIDDSRRMIQVVYEGELSDNSVRHVYESLLAEPSYQDGYGVLIDCTRATNVSLTAPGTRELARRAQNNRNRVAIVAADPVAYGMARMYQTLTDGGSNRIGCFDKHPTR